MTPARSVLTVRVPAEFDLPCAVCSYGYFLLAPNRWDPITQRLTRPLTGHDDRVIETVIDQPRPDRIRITCGCRVDRQETAGLRHQVNRMLRLDEDFTVWHRLHRPAKRARFDRLFRSPSVFEDMVKTITSCNVTWPSTMRMNRLLCEQIGDGAFPTPAQLSRVRVDTLQRRCKVGYRAQRISRLARLVVRGQLDLSLFEDPARTTDEIYEALLQIHGIGPFAAANLCQLLSRYDRLAIDTETYRHFRQEHGIEGSDDLRSLHKKIENHYARFAPFQFLAYWFELWRAYQKRFGNARQWTDEDPGPRFTASNLK